MQVERFRDAVVGSAVERHIVRGKPLQRIGQVGAGGIEDRHVEQPRGAGRRRRSALALPGVEADVVVIAARRDEGGLPAIHLLQFEAEHAAIEIQRPLEVGDLQVNMADARSGRDGRLCWTWQFPFCNDIALRI